MSNNKRTIGIIQPKANQYAIPDGVKYSHFKFDDGAGAAVIDHGSNGIGDLAISGTVGTAWSANAGWFTPNTTSWIEAEESAAIDGIFNLEGATQGGIICMQRIKLADDFGAIVRNMWYGGTSVLGFIQFAFESGGGGLKVRTDVRKVAGDGSSASISCSTDAGITDLEDQTELAVMWGVDVGAGRITADIKKLNDAQVFGSGQADISAITGEAWPNSGNTNAGFTMFTDALVQNPSAGTFNASTEAFRNRDTLLIRTDNEFYSKRDIIIDQYAKGGTFDVYPFMNDL